MSNCFDIHHLDLPKVFAPQKPLLISQYLRQRRSKLKSWLKTHSAKICTSKFVQAPTPVGRELVIKIIKDTVEVAEKLIETLIHNFTKCSPISSLCCVSVGRLKTGIRSVIKMTAKSGLMTITHICNFKASILGLFAGGRTRRNTRLGRSTVFQSIENTF